MLDTKLLEAMLAYLITHHHHHRRHHHRPTKEQVPRLETNCATQCNWEKRTEFAVYHHEPSAQVQ